MTAHEKAPTTEKQTGAFKTNRLNFTRDAIVSKALDALLYCQFLAVLLAVMGVGK